VARRKPVAEVIVPNILKSELTYHRVRLIFAGALAVAPPLALLIMAIVVGGFQHVNQAFYALVYVLGGMLFMASAFTALNESPEPRGRRLPMLMITPLKGSAVWLEVILSRITLLAPAMIASLIFGLMAPEDMRSFAVFMASGFSSFALLILGLLYLHMGFKRANSPRIKLIIILWDLVLVGRIVVPILFGDWSSAITQPPEDPSAEPDWNAVSGMDLQELISWAETVITLALCYWTFTKRQSYLSK